MSTSPIITGMTQAVKLARDIPPISGFKRVISAEQAHHNKMVKLLGRNKTNAPHSNMREQMRRIRQQERQANK